MTKTVYTGQEVPHIFATRPDAIARNSNRTLFCERGTLYSYRHSAPIAAWHNGKILINTDRYSVTTSKHQSWARSAVRHLEKVYLPDLRDVLGNPSRDGCAAYIVKRAKEIDALREKAGRARSEWRKAAIGAEIAELESACAYVWREIAGKRSEWRKAVAVKAKADKAAAIARYTRARAELESAMENARRDMESARVQYAQDGAFYRLDNARAQIRRYDSMGAGRGLGLGATATFSHAAKLMGKTWAAECERLAIELHAFADSLSPEIDAARAAYDKAQAAKHAERIAQWLAGENVTYPHNMPIVCRVKGDTVETSQGARVPLADALRLAGLAKECREKGRGLDLRGVAVGQYTGTRIDATGTLVVGCHSIPWESIADAMARFEGAGA
jgi:hypothetical protein